MNRNGVIMAIEAIDGDVTAADSARCADLLRDVRLTRGWLDAAEARITSRMTVLHDAAGGAPAADVHTRCGGVSAAEGKRKERRSKTLDEAPAFGDALADGAIGAEHVDALANATARLDDEVKASLLDEAPDLLGAATTMSPERFGRHIRDRARNLERDNGLARNVRQRRDTYLSRKLNAATGMIEGRFALHPELADQVFGAVDRQVAAMIAEGEHRRDPAFVNRTVNRNQLAAEELGQLVAGGHQAIRPAEADITVIIDAATAASGDLHDHSVCETSQGLDLPPASVQRLLCTGRITPIIVDADGNALDAGDTIRHANRRQRRALHAMYRTCAFHGCDVEFDRCEIHHIVPWEHGGLSDFDNLIPICSRHHHVVHESGWSLTLEPDRTLVIRQPDGAEFGRTRPDLADLTRQRNGRRRTAA
ncbi:MAG: HNH endonuclease [Ilumatobacteraceae bacterium]|nr:HNH endonuclease [Ilumatobacteraceae bacterium]